MKKGVLQMIDSLNVGGAEVMSVNIANNLNSNKFASHLCATRLEGPLRKQIDKNVGYIYLKRKKTIDFSALIRLRKYCRSNRIQIVHAHSTSIYFATLLKLISPGIQLIWHDHYGKGSEIQKRKTFTLKICSLFFKGIISVNQVLFDWAQDKLWNKNVMLLNNFSQFNDTSKETTLQGVEGKRITCVAGFRPQKDHFNLLKAFQLVLKEDTNASLHLIGKNYEDEYSKKVLTAIKEMNLENSVFHYGLKTDIKNILQQSTIGVLSSSSEGLPVSLIEYAAVGLPSVATNVGDCSRIISNKDYLVPPNDSNALGKAILDLINNKESLKFESDKLKEKFKRDFSLEMSIQSIEQLYVD